MQHAARRFEGPLAASSKIVPFPRLHQKKPPAARLGLLVAFYLLSRRGIIDVLV